METIERNTIYGPVVGVDESARSGALAWKGLPFAKPPTGELRWRAPREPDCWTAPRPALQFGNACAQTGRVYGPGRNNRYDRSIGASLGATVGSEDCLYVNIWSPASTPAGPLPVIVFVHGGSNITGYTADPLYDGGALAARANAVVVTVNYRLGIFGFLNLPQLKHGLDAGDDSGNFALLDIVKALQFINRNIANFGGDPGNVTLMGQSAGAVNVWSLLASPLLVHAAPQLVHRALPISGGLSLAADLAPGAVAALQPAAAREAQGTALLVHALIAEGVAADEAAAQAWVRAHGDREVADWLRARSADSLLGTVAAQLAPRGLAGSCPIPDGAVVPRDPIAAMRAGHYVKVPVLAGIARDEGKLFPSALALAPALGGVSGRLLDDLTAFGLQFDYLPDDAPQTSVEQWIPAQYLPVGAPGTGFNARTGQITAMIFTSNRDLLLDLLRAQQDEVWHYRFDWDEQPAPFNDIYGAAHGFDVPFLFGNFGPSTFATVMAASANRPGRLALSAAMMDCVAAFCRHGDPNHAGLGVDWPAWPATLLFDAGTDATQISVVQKLSTPGESP
ncbi:MAG: carboxylesterase family protein [Pseudomonadota bacterium]